MSIEIGLSKLSHSVGVLYILRAENCPNYSIIKAVLSSYTSGCLFAPAALV